MLVTKTSEGNDQLFRPSVPSYLESSTHSSKNTQKTNPDPRLADGMPLPKYLREKFPKHLLGMPIQEIDPFYESQKTYLIVSTKWVIHRFISPKSLWILSPFNRLRWFLIRTVTHSFFHYFMLVVILSLAGLLPVSRFFHEAKVLLQPYYWIFTVEAVIKILAYGLVMKPFSYLRNPWNWMDFILTLVGWYTECFMEDMSLYGIQCLRVLRIIWFFTYPRLSFSWMFHSLHLMKDLLIYGATVFVIFTIFAQIQYQGVFLQSCHANSGLLNGSTSEILLIQNSSSVWLCPKGHICATDFGKNSIYCSTNFDNFFSAALGTLQLMSKDSWDHLFSEIAMASGSWNIVFFLTVVIFGNYLLINLIAAQIAVSLYQFLDILNGKLPIDKLKRLSISTVRQEIDITNTEVSPIFKVEQEVVSLTNFQWDANNGNVEQFQVDNDDDDDTEDVIVDDVENVENQATTSLKQRVSSLWANFMNAICIWDCCNCWLQFQTWLTRIVLSRYFSCFICSCILSNLIILTMDHHHMPPNFSMVSFYSSYVFTAIYLIEVVLKILALSPKPYFKESWNVFEFLIAIGCTVELWFENISGLAIMRFFRMFRVLRFARWWPGFGALMRTITNNSIVLFVIVLLFATMGLFLFGEDYARKSSNTKDSDQLQGHVMDFTWSLLLVIRALCGEWTENLTECRLHSGWICFPYFAVVLVIGNLALFHLFITMLMAAVQSNNLCETGIDHQQNLFLMICNFFNSFFSCFAKDSTKSKRITENVKFRDQVTVEIRSNSSTQHFRGRAKTETLMAENCCWDIYYKCFPGWPLMTSFCVAFCKKWHWVRRITLVLINNKYYDIGMVIIVMMTTIPLCLDETYFRNSTKLKSIIVITDLTVFVIFSLEIFLKTVGFGFRKCFSDHWLCFDFIITGLHLSAIAMKDVELYGMIFISIRPLKIIPHMENLKMVISTMLYQISLLLDTILACGVFWLLFGVTGMQLFSDCYYRCVDSEGRYAFIKNDTLQNDECISHNFTWMNSNVNFDNIQNAFLALLQMATLKGWMPILHVEVNNSKNFYRSQRELNIYMEWFFILFIIFGVFGCFALILSTFVRKVNEQRKQLGGGYVEMLMTDRQKKVYILRRRSYFQRPSKGIRFLDLRPLPFIVQLASSKIITIISIIFIFCNIGFTIAFYQSPESDELHSFYGYFDLGFFIVFALEVGVKLTAFGCQFFRKSWNIYDFGILLISFVCYVLLEFRIVLFRTGLLGVLRILRLIRWLKCVQRIFSKILFILPALLNVGVLLLLLTSSYAIFGMACFKDIPVMPQHGEHLRFNEFLPALIIMIEVSFGSSWDFVYDSLVPKHNAVVVTSFLLSYLFSSYLVIIQCGAIVLLEQCDYLQKKLQLGVTEEDLENYKATWRKMDPEAKGRIHRDRLPSLLNSLKPPFQIQQPTAAQIAQFDNPADNDGNQITFTNVLQVLVMHLDDHNDPMTRSSDPIPNATVSIEVATTSSASMPPK